MATGGEQVGVCKLSLRAKRGNLVRAMGAATGTRLPRRFAPRNDNYAIGRVLHTPKQSLSLLQEILSPFMGEAKGFPRA